MSRSNVRPKSASPPPENVSIDNVSQIGAWMGQKTYFLAKEYSLEEVDPFEMLMFEHTDDQWERVLDSDGRKVKDIFELQIRYWKVTKNIMYYIRTVVIEGGHACVTFVRRWIGNPRRDEFTVPFQLAHTWAGLPNPLQQDNMPREHAIQLFSQHTDKEGRPMPISHIVKFFNACQYILIAHSCRMDRDPVAPVAGLTDARLKRMTNIMLSTWEMYPSFARRYHKDPMPVEDQQLSKMTNPEASFGSIVVLLKLKRCEEDYLPYVKADEKGQKDLSYVRKLLAAGKDPLPILWNQMTKKEREYLSPTLKTVEELRW
jgi:hypothetical protein